MTPPQLRQQLQQTFPTDSDFEAFVIDYFKEVFDKFSSGMDRQRKENLLLTSCSPQEIENALTAHTTGRSSQKAPLQPLAFHLPPRELWFSGRTRELDELDQRLRTGRAVALVGVGGLGKSSLARAYLAQHPERDRIRAWVSAASRLALETGLAELGQALFAHGFSQKPLPPADRPGERAAWTLEVLAQTPGWLLVLDNADEPDELDGLWPDTTHGHLLITSRSPAVPWPAFEIRAWDAEEALDYLRKRTGQSLLGDEEQAARDLLSEVETLPLAVEAIATFVATHKTSMIDYHAAFMKERTRLFPKPAKAGKSGKADDPKADPRRSVHTVWALALKA